MTGIVYELKIGLRPRAVQIPSTTNRTDDVISTLNDNRGNLANSVQIVQELAVPTEEAAVNKVMTFNARQRARERGPLAGRDLPRIRTQIARRTLPDRPGPSGSKAYSPIRTRQPLVVGPDHIAPLCLGDWSKILLPSVWKDCSCTRGT